MTRRANIPVLQPVQANSVKNMLGLQDIVRSDTLTDDVQSIQQRREQNPSQQVAGNFMNRVRQSLGRDNPTDFMTRGIQGIQDFQQRNQDNLQRSREEVVKEEETVGSISPDNPAEHGDQVLKVAALEDLVSRSLGPEAERKLSEVSNNLLGISRVDENISINEELIPTAQGGLIGMALGGRFEGRVPGDGHGMQDNVFMPIQERGEQIATLAVSPKEYVVDAHTMSALGNGNADKGADVMDNVVEHIREKAYGTDQQPNQIDGLAALRPMIERV